MEYSYGCVKGDTPIFSLVETTYCNEPSFFGGFFLQTDYNSSNHSLGDRFGRQEYHRYLISSCKPTLLNSPARDEAQKGLPG